jgi:hypothetical protein
MRSVLPLLSILTGLALATACPQTPAKSAASDAGETTSSPGAAVDAPAEPALQRPALPEMNSPLPKDPVAAIARFLPGAGGHCVQIRSVPTRLEADQLAAAIRKQAKLPVHAIEADLGERGVWWRLCVGLEPDELVADAKGRSWTAEGGALRPFMADVEAGHALYQLQSVEGAPDKPPSEKQAAAMLRARPTEARAPVMATTGRGELVGVVSLPLDELSVGDVAVIDSDGDVLAYDADMPGGCASCKKALTDVRVSRRLMGAGDVGPWPGEELLIEESGADGTRVVTLYVVEGDRLVRRAFFLTGTSSADLKVVGEARAVQADGEPGDELALVRVELPIVDDRLCALRRRVQILKLSEAAPAKLDEDFARTMGVAEQTGGAGPAKALIAAFDKLGAWSEGSRTCAAYLSKGRDAGVATTCIARISELVRQGRPLDAVNAGGMLSAASETFRVLAAGPLYKAAEALSADTRLTTGSGDCEAAPLVGNVSGKRLEHVVRLAHVRLEQRLDLADVEDDVFVTAARDFGPQTPFGELADKWMDRLQVRLPARHAAIQARIAQAASAVDGRDTAPGAPDIEPAPAVPTPGNPMNRGRTGISFEEEEDGAQPAQKSGSRTIEAPGTDTGSGYIRIEVHEEETP